MSKLAQGVFGGEVCVVIHPSFDVCLSDQGEAKGMQGGGYMQGRLEVQVAEGVWDVMGLDPVGEARIVSIGGLNENTLLELLEVVAWNLGACGFVSRDTVHAVPSTLSDDAT